MRTPPDSFLESAAHMDIQFEGDDLDRLGHWLELLVAGNERMNLTRILHPEDAWHRHVLDSLSLLPMIATAGARSLIDIGSVFGGGLQEPGGKKQGCGREDRLHIYLLVF